MKLKTKLVALSLFTLLLPWSGWKLLQELERYLRDTQEGALLGSARTVAAALPLEFQTGLIFAPDQSMPLRPLDRRPVLDGYRDDWPGADDGYQRRSPDGLLSVSVYAGAYGGRIYLFFDVRDESVNRATPAGADRRPSADADAIVLLSRNPHGLYRFTLRPEAPGPLQLQSLSGEGGQLEGYWLDVEGGYHVEILLPAAGSDAEIGFEVEDGALPSRGAGTLNNRGAASDAPLSRMDWVSLVPRWQRLSEWLADVSGRDERTWLVDRDGWVLADVDDARSKRTARSGPEQQTTWLQRFLYRVVAGSRTVLSDEWPAQPIRLGGAAVTAALAGGEGVDWAQDPESAVVRNTVAAPVVLDGRVRGAVVVQSSSDGLLVVTNRALGRLLLTTLALAFGLAAGLWYFASRLSRRVRRLSGAVSHAMEDRSQPQSLPLREDRDELGELARNNEKLLQAVADYGQYLQTLAGKLSHELKTPLAITRSSLENLAGQEMDASSRQFLERAREGVDRQAAIVRAMSEASRLEASIGVADWETIDLVGLVRRCAEAYRSVHRGRRIGLRLPEGSAMLRCAPDLLAQALDKLVDNAVSLSGESDTITLVLRPAGETWELAVENTGSTLPDELRERLFDSLVSVRARRGAEPHLGLGLYIVRLVVAAHRGQVSARNLPDGTGVEFLIRLPAA
ncbi:MAG: ATP-binding protein [Lysobacterales bacterium]|jgi:dedicated sortase system histidine kinase